MKPERILYSSPFVPAEWIAAHGWQPHRIFPRGARDGSVFAGHEGLCPFAEAFAEESAAGGAAAVIVATTCDQMRRVSEPLTQAAKCPVFVLNVPATWQSAAANGMYRGELARLGRFLVRLGGAAPSPRRLAETMLEYDQRRQALQAARETIGARVYAERLAALYQGAPGEPHAPSRPGVPPGGEKGNTIRVALLGGPLLRDHLGLYDMLEAAGARVVLDGTETGERTLPAPFDRARLPDHALDELARAYFQHIPDVFRRPNDILYEWLKRELAARQVQGMLLLRCVWCDLWHAEVQRLKDSVAVPVVELDPGGGEGFGPRAGARLQALLEMLR